MAPQTKLWQSLEAIPRLFALPIIWRKWLGDDLDTFRAAFLQAMPAPAASYPCPRSCGCWHRISPLPSGPPLPSDGKGVSPALHRLGEGRGEGFTALCQCDPPSCPELTLTLADITLWELNWTSLARALRIAFGLDAKLAALGLPGTGQIGAWSADAVPVILTIQSDSREFRAVVAQLVARLRQKFILFAPTSRHFDATCQELLANAGAAFFPIDTNVTLPPHGTLHPNKTPGDLFAKFTPEPKDSVDEDVARQTLALAKALDSEQRFRKAPVYTVFLLYCSEGLTVKEIAKRCRCARSVVFTRLKLLRQKLGRNPAELRQYSAQFENIEKSISDPRARSIYRKGTPLGHDAAQEAET